MANQISIPASNAVASGYSPQAVAFPFATGTPKEGPFSVVVSLVVPNGQTSATLHVDLAQIKMSMIQSIMVSNEANPVAISVKVGTPAVTFGIQSEGTQIIPVFQTASNIYILVTLASVQSAPIIVTFQLFNTWVAPASWVSNLTVNGAVDINQVQGGVNVQVQNANNIPFSINAEPTGGASVSIESGLTNTLTQIKSASGPATFKGCLGLSSSAGFIQIFDAASPSAVTLGTTVPTLAIPVLASAITAPLMPPEGIATQNGIVVAFTTLFSNATAPTNNWQGEFFYA
jgi:hypothetical protein